MHGTKIFVGDKEKFEIWRFEMERENLAGINGNVQGTEKIVRDREKFEIEGVRDRESPLYFVTYHVVEIRRRDCLNSLMF